MFSYYGSKSKIVHLYPTPKFDKIIEPFAGSARYSLRFWEKDILLVDKYPVIVDVWNYLKNASEKDILDLSKIKINYRLSDVLKKNTIEYKLIGFLMQAGQGSPRDTKTKMDKLYMLKDIASQLFKIRHWTIKLADYIEIENEKATWFIDPPYMFGGEHQYKFNNKQFDFYKLSEWCKSRNGQQIVCENTKANWLPFKPMVKMQGTIHKTTEAIYSNYPTEFDFTQKKLFYE